jgi:hypothetical protein
VVRPAQRQCIHCPLSHDANGIAIMQSMTAMMAQRNCHAHFQAYNSSGSSGRGPENTRIRSEGLRPNLRSPRCIRRFDTTAHANEMQNSVSAILLANVEACLHANQSVNGITITKATNTARTEQPLTKASMTR